MPSDLDVKQPEAGLERTRTGQVYRANIDIVKKDDELMLVGDLPGADSEAIEINFEDGVLTIEGHVAPRCREGTNFLLHEYGVGNFSRTFRVSEHIDSSRIHAEYHDGVLTVHLPKVEQVKPRKITVNAG